MRQHSHLMFVLVVLLLIVAGSSRAQPVQELVRLGRWEVEDGGNGHWYGAYAQVRYREGRGGLARFPIYVTWSDAHGFATEAGGYLATATSPEENAFIYDLIDDPLLWTNTQPNFGPWLGGFQSPSASAAEQGWQWVTGEPFHYAAWEVTEPNDYLGLNESRLQFFTYQGTREPTWSDSLDDPRPFLGGQPNFFAYVVEFEANPVPEPATLVLLGATLLTFTCLERRIILSAP